MTSSVEHQTILDSLTAHKCPIAELKALPESGVYALFLNGESLGTFPVGLAGLVYVGTSRNLAQREFDTHFSSRGTGFSTVRRSFGAILKQELKLKAEPRGKGLTRQDLLCYVFNPSGEERLTEWLHRSVRLAVHPTTSAKAVEDELIPLASPLLNLTKWKNPYRTEIMRLRAACVDEAGSHN